MQPDEKLAAYADELASMSRPPGQPRCRFLALELLQLARAAGTAEQWLRCTFQAGIAWFRGREYVKALEVWNEIMLPPGLQALTDASAAEVLVAVGAAKSRLGDNEGAMESYLAAVARGAADIVVLSNMASTAFELGHHDEARELFELAVAALDPARPDHHWLLALSAASMFEDLTAMEFLARHLALVRGEHLGDEGALSYVERLNRDHYEWLSEFCIEAEIERSFDRLMALRTAFDNVRNPLFFHEEPAVGAAEESAESVLREMQPYRMRASAAVLNGES